MNPNEKIERPILRLPLKNFRPLGPLTPEREEWWRDFGRALKEAQRDWDRGRR